jgi:methylated-DNA-protein-cysteine methyltransferase-like protein
MTMRPRRVSPKGIGEPSDKYRRIYDVVVEIPNGRVATYGQVAVLAELPRQARLVGYALHALPADSRVPWHRVVNAKGEISIRGDGLGHDELQAHLLRREGVRFVANAVPLPRYRWQPRATVEPPRARRATRRESGSS